MDLIARLRSSVDSATVIALPAVALLPIPLREQDLALRGANITVTDAGALASLFTLIEQAGISAAGGGAGMTVLRLKISLTNSSGTVAKLLFDGLPSPAGVIHGSVNGQGVFADAAFARRLRRWVCQQKELASAKAVV